MADVVGAIIDGITTQVVAALGAGYQELAYKGQIEENEEDQASKAYGVRPLGGTPVAGVNRAFSVDQVFEVILTDVFTDDASDEESDSLLRVMYEKAVAIFQQLVNTRAGATEYVLNVFNPTLLDPEFFPDQAIVGLRMQVTVRWRKAL